MIKTIMAGYIQPVKMLNITLLVALTLTSASVLAERPAEVKFNQHIRPILSDKCFHCHGPDKADREADLRLDTAEGILSDLGGYFAIVPKKPEESEVYKRITHADPDERMPPLSIHKTLSKEEIALIEQWIEEGAMWQDHWSYEPISQEQAPKVTQNDWVSNPIDNFVLNRLELEQLTPAAQANKHTLIRRVSFDLTGLPPSPEQINAFVNDQSANAYENLVDNLLASPAYGEHRAQYWLDAARYTDTHKFHFDNYRSIWPYRDWVVNAFNNNMAFDQFTIEQLAGDLLPNATLDQKVASGFNRNNATTHEGGVIDAEYEAIYAKDRTETMSTVWLGLTTGCANCHDHKFDPISQKEFFQLSAFFRNTTQKARDGNVFDTLPSIRVPNKVDRITKAELETQLKTKQAVFDNLASELEPEFNQWLASSKSNQNKSQQHGVAKDKLTLNLTGDENINLHNPKTHQNQGYFSVNQASYGETGMLEPLLYDQPFTISFWLKIPKKSKVKSLLRQVVLGENKKPFEEGASQWLVELYKNKIKFSISNGDVAGLQNHIWGMMNKPLAVNKWQHVVINYDGLASSKSFKYYINGEYQSSKNDGINQYGVKPFKSIGKSTALLIGKQPAKAGGNAPAAKKQKIANDLAKMQKSQYVNLRDINIYQNALSPQNIQALGAVNLLAQKTSDAQYSAAEKQHLLAYYLTEVNSKSQALDREINLLSQKVQKIDQRSPVTLITQERQDQVPFAHILIRGAYDKLGEKVVSATPAVLPKIKINDTDSDDDKANSRLDLANWLMRDDHPLTARVTVNRFWQSVFGQGLVKTAGDFGSQGTPPSHPMLLDWLAADFKDNGWDIKRTMKQIVMSSTYRQSSDVTAESYKNDPDNTLLARGPRYRLEAETIRDQVLYLSGLLVDKRGGPGVNPYQPQGLWKAVGFSGSNTLNFVQGTGEDLYRKSLYTFRKATAPAPIMGVFDAPDRETCSVNREITNTPLQALLLMNDPQFIEAARHMAEIIMTSSSDNKFRQLAETSLGRSVDDATIASLEKSYQRISALYQQAPEQAELLINIGDSTPDATLDKIELANWTMLASQVFNLDEFNTKY